MAVTIVQIAIMLGMIIMTMVVNLGMMGIIAVAVENGGGHNYNNHGGEPWYVYVNRSGNGGRHSRG